MKKTIIFVSALCLITIWGCGSQTRKTTTDMGIIPEQTMEATITELVRIHGEEVFALADRGVRNAAAFWMESDGTAEDFRSFCLKHFAGDPQERKELFNTLSVHYESLWGHFNQMTLELNKPLHLDVGPIRSVDVMFGSFSPSAHLTSDLFANQIAFLTLLNFPYYSLQEKAEKGAGWSRLEWAYARMGDVFTSRVPARLNQERSRISTASDNYISEYNIVMDGLLDANGQTLFPQGMRLISHWGLRDEIKSNYGLADGLQKQEIIYQVMQRIIRQEIPRQVINNPEVRWNPYDNVVYKEEAPMEWEAEPDTRYQYLLDHYRIALAADPYNPHYPTAIGRAFDAGLELSMEEVESLFVSLMDHPLMKQVGELVSQRLGRPLRPFDIWYDGFKARSGISEEELDRIVNKRYPSGEAFEAALPVILVQLGWDRERARDIASKIVVEASRGAGHAWGAAMRRQNSHLRTRIGPEGMDYKGYNIAIHEFGHNVEQTISLHDVDYYMMNGVPNTAFTEALAFIFQTRDLELLGLDSGDPLADDLKTLDILWGTYEIMGVSLVDMAVWRWMYDNPHATPAALREQTLVIARDIWNKYFAPVFGLQDEPILAIYSHMISYPLYLSAYPLGHLIEFQIEEYLRGKNLARETDRMFSLGRLIPQHWMHEAVGEPLSTAPLMAAAANALSRVQAMASH